jgi:DDE family transposase
MFRDARNAPEADIKLTSRHRSKWAIRKRLMHCKKLSAAPFANHQYKAKRPLRAAASPKCNQVSESGGCDCSEAVLLPVYAKKPRPRKPAISIVQAWNTHDCPDQTAPRCYSQRGTCEQWIEEGKGAIKWTRLSCWTFASNAVRLQLHALAYNLGTNVPGDFAADRGTAAAATTRASVRRAMVTRSRATDWRSASKCQGKWPDRPLGHDSSCPRGWQPSTTSHQSCRKAGKTRIFTPVREPSGESRLSSHV